ncbi:MAG: metallophosphoesterase [Verrucomicrobia bacterium]|nr:metallophosphoesterase [Verrucomicrobiota bacterium]
MNKLVAVGDIHHGPNLEQIDAAIEREMPDLTIFLGDYFDQFHDHFDHARRTAQWLKQSLNKPNRIHLWGNHDVPYGYSEYAHCPGYDPAKERAIRSVLDDHDWAKLKLWHIENHWLFTHAGLSRPYAPANIGCLASYLGTQARFLCEPTPMNRFFGHAHVHCRKRARWDKHTPEPGLIQRASRPRNYIPSLRSSAHAFATVQWRSLNK